eukprot:FR734894.1.p1 GENE.FR734894.1~~FR734894.1.p1  ORF type:complete len:174 (+),score=26.02 FR734894.1:52-522(+)
MKIDEPDTPFAYEAEPDEDENGMDTSVDSLGDAVPMMDEITLGSGDDGAYPETTRRKQRPQPSMDQVGGGHQPMEGLSLATNWAELEGKLESAAADDGPRLVGQTMVDAKQEESEEAEAERRKSFKAKRAAHYNEFERVKALRAQMAQNPDSDEDE